MAQDNPYLNDFGVLVRGAGFSMEAARRVKDIVPNNLLAILRELISVDADPPPGTTLNQAGLSILKTYKDSQK